MTAPFSEQLRTVEENVLSLETGGQKYGVYQLVSIAVSVVMVSALTFTIFPRESILHISPVLVIWYSQKLIELLSVVSTGFLLLSLPLLRSNSRLRMSVFS